MPIWQGYLDTLQVGDSTPKGYTNTLECRGLVGICRDILDRALNIVHVYIEM